jgi:hypothetical protein
MAEIVAPGGDFMDDHYPSEALLRAIVAEQGAFLIRTLSSTATHSLVQTAETARHMAEVWHPHMSVAARAMVAELQLRRQAEAAKTIQRHIVTRASLEALPPEIRSLQAQRLARLRQLSNGIVATHLTNEYFMHNVTLAVGFGDSLDIPSVHLEIYDVVGGAADVFIPAGDSGADSFVGMYTLAEQSAQRAVPTQAALMDIVNALPS